MALETETEQLHGGRLVAQRLRAAGVTKLFTLSGGHLFSIYDGCRAEGIDIVDVRHEQTAAFAAEGWAKATRTVGVAALTAGPGVTNGMSAMASAQANGSPVVVLGGRAPAMRWGMGSLQEIDHVPFVAPLVKSARTADSPAACGALVDEALRLALTPPTGPAFVDFPLDHVFSEGDASAEPFAAPEPLPAADVSAAAELLRGASRPVVMAGTRPYSARAPGALPRAAGAPRPGARGGASRRVGGAGPGLCGPRPGAALRGLWEEPEVPLFRTGLGPGGGPADHPQFFSRARSTGLKGADVALVVGV